MNFTNKILVSRRSKYFEGGKDSLWAWVECRYYELALPWSACGDGIFDYLKGDNLWSERCGMLRQALIKVIRRLENPGGQEGYTTA